MKKFLILFLLIIPFMVSAETLGPVEGEDISVINNNNEELNTGLLGNAKSGILIDAYTGDVIYEKNSHEKLAPASMTKMMSMLVIVEAIENNVVKWNDMITVSENASNMGGSQILLETGEQMSVDNLFKGVAVASGNDVVVTKKQSNNER